MTADHFLRRAGRRMTEGVSAVRAVFRGRDEELERRLLLSERFHDVRLVPVLSLLWLVSAVTAVRDAGLLRALVVVLLLGLASGTLWGFVRSRKRAMPVSGRRGRGVGFAFGLAALVGLLGCGLGLGRTADPAWRHLWAAAGSRQAVTVIAEISGHPEPLMPATDHGGGPGPDEPTTSADSSPCGHGCHFTAQLHRIRRAGDWLSLDVPVDVQCQTVCAGVRYGQTVQLILRVRTRDGRPATLSGTAVSKPRLVEAPSVFENAVSHLRHEFLLRSRSIPGEPGALLDGMVLGDRSRRSPESTAVMTTTGLTHLTAVSGANCSVVFASVVLVLRSWRVSRPVVMVLSLISLGVFGALVGPDSSVLRAVVMSAASLTVMMGGHQSRGLPLLCVSASGLLLAEPWLAWDLGFALSVAATAGILLAAQGLAQWLGQRMPYVVALGLSIPLAANLACAPLLVLIQPQLTPYSLLANALTAPLVAPVTLLGTAALPLAVVPGPISGMLIGWAGMATWGIWSIAEGTSRLPGALLEWPPGVLGLSTMAGFCCCQVGLLWLFAHPRAVAGFYRKIHARLRDGPRRPARGVGGSGT